MLFATYGNPRFLEYLQFENIDFTAISPLELSDQQDYVMFAELTEWKYQDVLAHVPQKVIEDIKEKRAILLYYLPDPSIDVEQTVEFHGFVCEKYGIDFFDFRIINTNFLIDNVDPFLYFCDAEFEYRIEYSNDDSIIQTFDRDKMLTVVDPLNSEYGSLIKSLIWQQGMLDQVYFEHKEFPCTSEVLNWEDKFHQVSGLIYPYEVNLPIDQTDPDMHRKSIASIVVQDWFDKDIQHLNMETFEAIDNNCLLMIIGSPGSYDILHHLGYKTFDRYLGEDYDQLSNNEYRLHGFFAMMYRFIHQQPEYRTNLIDDTKPIRSANRALLNTSKLSRIQKLLEEI